VALFVDVSSVTKTNAVTVRGRGDLHLGILLEKMRREGFEMSITPPEILYRTDPKTKEILEPIEQVIIELHPNFSNNLIEKMGNRKGVYVNSVQLDADRLRM
jgi:GTP-binding protein